MDSRTVAAAGLLCNSDDSDDCDDDNDDGSASSSGTSSASSVPSSSCGGTGGGSGARAAEGDNDDGCFDAGGVTGARRAGDDNEPGGCGRGRERGRRAAAAAAAAAGADGERSPPLDARGLPTRSPVPSLCRTLFIAFVGVSHAGLYLWGALRVAGRGATARAVFIVFASACMLATVLATAKLGQQSPSPWDGLLGAWMSMLAFGTAGNFCALRASSCVSSDHGAAPVATRFGTGIWWYYSYFWTVACILQTLRLPTVLPRRPQHIFGCVSLLGCVLLLVLYTTLLLGDSCALHTEGRAISVAAAVLITELRAFLEDGDGAGCRVLTVYLAAECVLHIAGLTGIHAVDAIACAILAVVIVVGLCLGLAALAAEDEDGDAISCCTSELYSRCAVTAPATAEDPPGGGGGARCGPRVARLRAYMRTWRGMNVVYIVNGAITFIIYGFLVKGPARPVVEIEQSRINAVRPLFRSDDTLHMIIASFGLLAVALGASNVLLFELGAAAAARTHDEPHARGACLARAQPLDRHFRWQAQLKSELLRMKIAMLEIYGQSQGAHSSLHVGLQIFAVASTVVVSSLSAYSILRSALSWADALRKHLRSPWAAWVATLAALLALQVSTGVFVVVGVVYETTCAASQCFLHTGLNVFGGYLWICLANELTLVLSNEASEPKVFAAVQSVRGVRALAVCLAVSIPARLVWRTLAWFGFCAHREETFRDIAASPLAVFYLSATALLALLAALALWALGGPVAGPPLPPPPPPRRG